MSLKTKSLEFGEFLFDVNEKVLLRNGERLSVNPKTLQLLETLLNEHGHLVEKERLMNTLWPDSYVEDANLAFTVSLLRKILDDSAQDPRFIETIPRRGYRFIAEVREGSERSDISDKTEVPRVHARGSWKSVRRLILAGSLVITAGMAFSGYWIVRKASGGSTVPILTVSENLSTNGKVRIAVISADGKNVFYTNGIEGQQSVWLRQLESSHSQEVIPPSDDFYYGLALSPDGNFLYFARSGRQIRDMGIYRVSILGGVPTKIVSGSEGWMSISPDGATISFVRCPYTNDEYCSLWVADAATGQNERKLTSRPQPIRIGDNEFSPDGKNIAFAVGQSLNQSNEFGLSEINIETGIVRELTTEKYFDIRSLTWLPDRKGLLIAASRIPTKRFRIWDVDPSGSTRSLTSDAENYTNLSLDKSANRLVSTQWKQDFRLFLMDRKGAGRSNVLADASRAAFFPNGKIVFASVMSGNEEIWSTNTDGSGQKQLTNDPADDITPIPSSDSKQIYFTSNRTGSSQVWRMSSDGSDQQQVTFKTGGSPVFVSSDGKWVYYHNGVDRTLWRASTERGNEELIFNKRAIFFSISPDSKYAAYSEREGKDRIISVASLADGQVVLSFRTLFIESSGNDIVWMPDGKSIVYVDGETAVNFALMLRPIVAGTEIKIANMGSEGVNSVAVAPDGNSFAVVQGGWKHDAVLISGLR